MKEKRISAFFIAIFILFSASLLAQRSGILTGRVIDGSNDESLAFTNIYIKGTSIGTVSDANGVYRFENVPLGDQVIVFSFIGFADQEIEVQVVGRVVQELDPVTMTPETIMGEEVVVTAQLRGQAAALNQQNNSNTIVNVVSREKIQEVPDANAAESIGRLPGVTIGRSAGEGSTVTVRGVSPRFNSITLNGMKIPSSETGNRSLDLSMISSDLLDGIEVYKALTPDMDADAVGGTVNLVTKTAESGFHARLQGDMGYHGLIKDLGEYKGSLTLSNRFLDDKLGILFSANASRANRNSDEFDADYHITWGSGNDTEAVVDHVYLTNHLETRDRIGASATFDYKLGRGKIVFDNFYSFTDQDVVNRGVSFFPSRSSVNYEFHHYEQAKSLLTSQLRGNHYIGILDIDWSLSYSSTTNDRPVSYGAGAQEEGAYISETDYFAPPQEIVTYAKFYQPGYTLENVFGGSSFGWSNRIVNDRHLVGQLNLKVPFFFHQFLNGYLKAGGKLRQKDRDREGNSYGINDGAEYYFVFRETYPEITDRVDRNYRFRNFIDKDYLGYTFPMGSTYYLPYVLDPDIQAEHYEKFSPIDSLWFASIGPKFDQYDALERIIGTYAMAEINVTDRIMLIAGVRMEHTFQEYSGKNGFIRGTTGRLFQINDTTGSKTEHILLPMFHMKFNILKDLSLRIAATKTLTRPDFLNITPFTRIDYGSQFREVHKGSMELITPTAWNYDVSLNYYSHLGLLSLSGFYKKIQDVDIPITLKDLKGNPIPGDPDFNPTFGFIVTNPINSTEPTYVYGFEIDMQTNFRWLPKPFDGIVLSGNFAHIKSETYYPFFPVDYPPPTYQAVIKDTFAIDRMPGQADFVANGTLGYEKGGFSGWVSMNFQGVKLTNWGGDPRLSGYSAPYMRWDAVLTYKFLKYWTVIVNLSNFTNTPEKSYVYIPERPTKEEYYGWIATLGIRFKL